LRSERRCESYPHDVGKLDTSVAELDAFVVEGISRALPARARPAQLER
jgi:hypothetical protein